MSPELFEHGESAAGKSRGGASRALVVLPLLLFAALAGFCKSSSLSFSNLRAAASPAAPAGYSFSPSQFALADFDGDVRPDLASVQTASSGEGLTKYSIQLRLTKAGIQSISLVAPAGGLWIEARDVNGDHAIDLIFTTAWLKQPVAILLNDGHGRFSRAEPKTFPAAFRDSSQNWASQAESLTDALGVASSPNVTGISWLCWTAPLPANTFGFGSRASRVSNLQFRTRGGRAPPLVVFV